jgi:chromosome segregation ATPase
MKLSYIYLLLLLTSLMASCENYKEKMEEEQKAQRLLSEQILGLEEEEKLIKGEYGDAMQTLSAIDQTLSEMAMRNKEMDKLIRQKDLAKGTTEEQVIMAKLVSLRDANINADTEARRLRSKAKAFKVENIELKKLIEKIDAKFVAISGEVDKFQTNIARMGLALKNLEEEVKATETDLSKAYAELKVKTSKLERNNIQLESELADLKNKNDFIAEDAIGYIVCGTKKALRQNKILRLLSAKTLTKEYQTQVKVAGSEINYFEDDLIDCGNGIIEHLLPVRNGESYKIEGGKITILDKKSFWATSKSVVLVKK